MYVEVVISLFRVKVKYWTFRKETVSNPLENYCIYFLFHYVRKRILNKNYVRTFIDLQLQYLGTCM